MVRNGSGSHAKQSGRPTNSNTPPVMFRAPHRSASARTRRQERSWRRVRAEALRWGARNITGGVLLFIGLPLCFAWLPVPFLTIAGIMAAAVNVHHFFVDGVIWKLRDNSNSSALMISIAELGSAAAPQPSLSRPIAA